MKVDNMELVGRIEHTFKIQIPESVAQKILTVGDMYDVVKNQVSRETANYCLTQLFFYRLRNRIHETFGVPKAMIRQETLLDDIIPVKSRRKLWEKLAGSAETRFPNLVLPKKYEMVLIWTGIATVVGSLYLSIVMFLLMDSGILSFTLPIAGACLTYLVSLLMQPFRTEFPEKNLLNLTYNLQLLNGERLKDQPLTRQDLEILVFFMDPEQVVAPESYS
ncbi:MAG: hypothetical protein EOO04_11405 [Chitinophagaceae bacterium]|nr:MAG: hypothetical protein EOO04_11405 [Chitinophagaceae bacterium]